MPTKSTLLAMAVGCLLLVGVVASIEARERAALEERSEFKQERKELRDLDEEQTAFDRELARRKESAVATCKADNGIPTMGLGFDVVCVRRESVAWVRSIEP